MAKPTTLTDCRDYHAHLQQMGLAGIRIPRPRWDQAMAQVMECSSHMVRVLTETGKLHGLWHVASGHGPGNIGHVTVSASSPAAPSPQAEAPQPS